MKQYWLWQHASIAALSLFMCLVLLAGCTVPPMPDASQGQTPGSPTQRQEMIFTVPGDNPATFNPLLATDTNSGSAIAQIYPSLLGIDPTQVK
jgi:ABC-type oligopeptide transport system substrate-binding subunit